MTSTTMNESGHTKLTYIDSVTDVNGIDKPCFDICKHIDSSTIQYVCDLLDEDDARRLVACWNRLLPFTTEEIENGIDLVALQRQARELREALNELLQWTLHGDTEGSICGACGNHNGSHHPDCPTIKARAAASEGVE